MEHKLCWECRNYFKKNNFLIAPSSHCHHPFPENEPEPYACSLTNPEIECFDYEKKMAHGWCKYCLLRQTGTLWESCYDQGERYAKKTGS